MLAVCAAADIVLCVLTSYELDDKPLPLLLLPTFCMIFSHCVPLPAAGAPAIITRRGRPAWSAWNNTQYLHQNPYVFSKPVVFSQHCRYDSLLMWTNHRRQHEAAAMPVQMGHSTARYTLIDSRP